jgi:hypothetical protein
MQRCQPFMHPESLKDLLSVFRCECPLFQVKIRSLTAQWIGSYYVHHRGTTSNGRKSLLSMWSVNTNLPHVMPLSIDALSVSHGDLCFFSWLVIQYTATLRDKIKLDRVGKIWLLFTDSFRTQSRWSGPVSLWRYRYSPKNMKLVFVL